MTKPLVPPMQNDPGIHIFDPTNQRAVPYYRFATIQLSQEEDDKRSVVISTAIPEVDGRILETELADEDDTDEDTIVENVRQTYTVQIPYTDTVDRKEITKLRIESRSRMVPIKRKRPKASSESDHEPVQQAYTVSVPYTEQIECADGSVMAVTRSRLETRTRWVDPNEVSVKFQPRILFNSQDIDSVECYSMTGKRLTSAELLERLQTPRPALLLNSKQHIAPYFAQLLSPNAIIVVDPWLQVTDDTTG